MKKKLYLVLSFYRWFWCWILYCRSKNKDYIKEDLSKSAKSGGGSLYLEILRNLPFRSVFYYRTSDQKIISFIAKIFVKPLPQIEIYIKPDAIGPGFRILHNTGVVITPYKAGKNLTVGQGVTIGRNSNKEYPSGRQNPLIGDNVHIATNAVVIGGITIGDNVIIGAGAVVVSDIPSNCVAAGVPAKIIKQI